MKKFISVLVAFCFALLPVLSLADYSAMSDDELQTELNLIRAEITKRSETKEAKEILAEADGLTVTMKGEPVVDEIYDGSKKLILAVTVVNTSEESAGISMDEAYINGWKVSGMFIPTLEPGTKLKQEIEFYHVDENAELEKLEDLEDIKFIFHTFEAETFMRKTGNIEKTVSFK